MSAAHILSGWTLISLMLGAIWIISFSPWRFNWLYFFRALPGIVADMVCQMRIDVAGLFKRKALIEDHEEEAFHTHEEL